MHAHIFINKCVCVCVKFKRRHFGKYWNIIKDNWDLIIFLEMEEKTCLVHLYSQITGHPFGDVAMLTISGNLETSF